MMKVAKIISKRKSGKRMEVIAVEKEGPYRTLHIHRGRDGWKFYKGLNDHNQKMYGPVEVS